MQARPQALPFDPATLPGLSERLLRSHHQNNYGGAVARLNAIRAQLSGLDFASTPGFVLNGLKREELIATNSMLLHEVYFECLGEGGGGDPSGALADAIVRDFGSLAHWRAEFVAMGKALGGGSGWVLLVFQPREGTLVNQWAADHTHAVAGGVPILALTPDVAIARRMSLFWGAHSVLTRNASGYEDMVEIATTRHQNQKAMMVANFSRNWLRIGKRITKSGWKTPCQNLLLNFLLFLIAEPFMAIPPLLMS